MGMEPLVGSSGVQDCGAAVPVASAARPSSAPASTDTSPQDFQTTLEQLNTEQATEVTPSDAPPTEKTEKISDDTTPPLDPSQLPLLFIPQPTPEVTPVAAEPAVLETESPHQASTLEALPDILMEAFGTPTSGKTPQELPKEVLDALEALPDAKAKAAPEETKHTIASSEAAALPQTPAPALPSNAPAQTETGATTAPTAAVAGTSGPAPAQASAPAASSMPPAPIALRELPQQLIPIIRRVNAEGNQELRIRLDPPRLGELNLVVESGQDGISVRVVTQSRETLLLLQDQRSALQDELSRQNLTVSSFSASLAGDTGGQRSSSRFFTSPSQRTTLSSSEGAPELTSVSVRLPLHAGGLDTHA